MKKALIAVLMMVAGVAQAEIVNLACQGQFTEVSTTKNEKPFTDKRYDHFNVTIDTINKTTTLGPSYYTGSVNGGLIYKDLMTTDAWYNMMYNHSNGNQVDSVSFQVMRYNGQFEISISNSLPFYTLEVKGKGTCEVNRQWNPKF